MKKHQMYIAGKWEDPASGEWFETLNPYTAEPWALIPRGTAEDAARAVQAAASRDECRPMAEAQCHATRRADAQVGRPDRGKCGTACGD